MQIAERTGKTRQQVKNIIRYREVKAVWTNPGGRHENFYDESAVEIVNTPAEKGQRKVYTDEELKERHKEQLRKFRERRKAEKPKKKKSGYVGKMWKVSVRNAYSQWIVKACSLTMADARMISDELNSVGVAARYKPHSFGIRRTA